MDKRLKLALAAVLGFSTACSSVKNGRRQAADAAEPVPKSDSTEVVPTVRIDRTAIRVMYGVPRPRPDSVRQTSSVEPDAAAGAKRPDAEKGPAKR